MGRSIRVRYTVEMNFIVLQGSGFHYATPTAWPGKYVGRVTPKALARVVEAFEASLKPGECNDHIRKTGVIGVHRAIVRDADRDGAIIAIWERK